MMNGSWTHVPTHASQAPWLPAKGAAATAMPALNDPRQIAKLHDVAASQHFISSLPAADRPITTLAMTAEALKATRPGVIYGENLQHAWEHDGKQLPDDARFVVFLAHPLPTGKTKLDLAHLDPHQARVVAIAREADVLKCSMPKNYAGWKQNAARVNRSFHKSSFWQYMGRAVMQRSGYYFGGAHEGLSLPKNMGLILASLGVTSVTLSAFLYGVLEMADYLTVDSKLAEHKKKKLLDQQNQLLTQPMA